MHDEAGIHMCGQLCHESYIVYGKGMGGSLLA